MTTFYIVQYGPYEGEGTMREEYPAEEIREGYLRQVSYAEYLRHEIRRMETRLAQLREEEADLEPEDYRVQEVEG